MIVKVKFLVLKKYKTHVFQYIYRMDRLLDIALDNYKSDCDSILDI